jgi:hypothetical protein
MGDGDANIYDVLFQLVSATVPRCPYVAFYIVINNREKNNEKSWRRQKNPSLKRIAEKIYTMISK